MTHYSFYITNEKQTTENQPRERTDVLTRGSANTAPGGECPWHKAGSAADLRMQALVENPIHLFERESCAVEGCDAPAAVIPHLFTTEACPECVLEIGPDFTCAFLCQAHTAEDIEARKQGATPYTNSLATTVVYRPVSQPTEVK